MFTLTAIPGLSPEAIQQLASCGIDSPEVLAGLPPAELHRVLELTAWQKGMPGRAPTREMVHHWVETARRGLAKAGLSYPAEEIVLEAIPMTAAPPPPVPRSSYLPPSQRARMAAAGPPVPAAARVVSPEEIQEATVLPVGVLDTSSLTASGTERAAPSESGFNSFKEYQAGLTRVPPLSRRSIDAPGDRPPLDRVHPTNEELARTVRRGVVHPNPLLLVLGALISLLWRLALVAAVVAVPWILFAVPRPSDYARDILIAVAGLGVLGVAQLIILSKARCRICSCHLFYSRDCVKNRKAHSLPLIGKTASLSLHLLLFQWFRCMYCGTAIKLWAGRMEQED